MSRNERNRALIEELWPLQNGMCFFCDAAIIHTSELETEDRENPWAATLCRVVPKSLNGSPDRSNLAIAHMHCNSSRNKRTVEEWAETLSKLNLVRGFQEPKVRNTTTSFGNSESAKYLEILLSEMEPADAARNRKYANKAIHRQRELSRMLAVLPPKVFNEVARVMLDKRIAARVENRQDAIERGYRVSKVHPLVEDVIRNILLTDIAIYTDQLRDYGTLL